MQVLAFAEEADEEEFGGGVRVQAAGDEEVGDGDAVGGFLPFEGQGAERGGGDGGTGVDVGDGGEDGVEGCREDLEGVGGFHGVAGVFHFGAIGKGELGGRDCRGEGAWAYIRMKNMKWPFEDEVS